MNMRVMKVQPQRLRVSPVPEDGIFVVESRFVRYERGNLMRPEDQGLYTSNKKVFTRC
jgi:hypothetical protein